MVNLIRLNIFCLKWLTVVFLALTASGCAGTGYDPVACNSSNKTAGLPDNLNEVLYSMNQGLAAHYEKNHAKSNLCLAKAENRMDELFTQSISKKTASCIINDSIIPYRGEDFEAVMVNLFMALNYVYLNKWDDALVEARKVDNRLNIINEKYEADFRNAYTEDPFVRFIMGLLYEKKNEINNAQVSYRKAIKGYKRYEKYYRTGTPEILKKKSWRILSGDASSGNDYGEIFFLHYNGLCPVKIESAIESVFWDGYEYKMAIPIYKNRMYRADKCKILMQNKKTGQNYYEYTEICENIGAIAAKNLDDRIKRIKARAFKRSTGKYLTSKGIHMLVEGSIGGLAGLLSERLLNAVHYSTEKADIRCWNNLPDKISIAAFKLLPGMYSVSVDILDSSGNKIERVFLADIKVAPGSLKIISFRTVK